MTSRTAPPPATMASTVAFIDMGTNSIRLLVAQIYPNHSYHLLTQLKETVRLGEGEFADQILQPDAMERAVQVVRQFAIVAHASGAEQIIAVATSATREARNQRTFLRRLLQDAGVDVRVVSGMEEARLIYLGVVSGIDLGSKQALSIDIGGGSTEISVGNQDQHLYLTSLKLGAIRTTTRFLSDHTGPVPRPLYEQIRRFVRTDAVHALHELADYQPDVVLGGSGTIENLAETAARFYLRRPLQPDDALTFEQISGTIGRLCAMNLEERRSVAGLNPQRADIIIGGSAILHTFMEELHLPELRVTDRGLREGLLVDYLLRNGHAPLTEGLSVRARSVLQLGRTCRFNETHARTVARLALELFDSARAAGLHSLGDWERELLEYTAQLHHIGTFLSYSNYQRHSYYLIRNADLLGFDQTEMAIMATTALYHRKLLPLKKHPEFLALPAEGQKIVRILCLFLRLAEALDRSQAGHVRNARLDALKGGDVQLQVEADEDYQIELAEAETQAAFFKDVFDCRLRVATAQALTA